MFSFFIVLLSILDSAITALATTYNKYKSTHSTKLDCKINCFSRGEKHCINIEFMCLFLQMFYSLTFIYMVLQIEGMVEIKLHSHPTFQRKNAFEVYKHVLGIFFSIFDAFINVHLKLI